MKKIEILIKGNGNETREEAAARAIMKGIYGAAKRNQYADISISTETVMEKAKELQAELDIPGFIRVLPCREVQ